MKVALDGVVDMFGDDIEHLHGNLFRVRRNRIRMAHAGVRVEEGRIVYGNPRWFLNKDGQPEARGIVEKSKMDELRSSIQNSGLDNPIRLRPISSDEGSFLEIVNGERRFRCIERLCDDESACYNPSSAEMAPAEEVFEWVDCRIEHMDDCAALAVALKTNETSELIGDLASIEVVKAFRRAGHDDADILKATGKSVSWLRETDRIIGLDEVCLDCFEKDKITRKAALQLALIENAEERIGLLEEIIGVARGRHESRLRNLDKQIEDAEAKVMINSAAAEVAREVGEHEQAKKLSAAGDRAKKKVERARGERDKASAKSPKADARDIKRVRTPKALPHSRIRSDYIELIEKIIDGEGFDEEGNSLGVDLGALGSVFGVLSAIMNGDDDAMAVLLEFCPSVIEDESDVQEEESDESDDEDESDDNNFDEDDESDIRNESDDDADDLDEDDDDDDDDDGDLDEDDWDEDEAPPELESEFRTAVINEYEDEN